MCLCVCVCVSLCLLVQEYTVTSEDQFLVLASDGLWDVLKDQVGGRHCVAQCVQMQSLEPRRIVQHAW